MAWYINADQVADHISQRRLNLNPDNAAYYEKCKTLRLLEELVRKTPYGTVLYWDSVQIVGCNGCKWKLVRHQKCSCCRRNRHLKDNFEEDAE